MATQKQDDKQGNGGRAAQGKAIAVQHGQPERQLAREPAPSARRITRARPFALMRRMLEDLDDTSPFGLTSPFLAMRRMFDEMDRVLDRDPSGGIEWGARDVAWTPRIEVTQRDNQLLVRADLPGVSQDEIKISAEGDALVIEGERTLTTEDRDDVWSSECAYGAFRRVIALPDGADADQAVARYDNGVLEVSVPIPATQTRRIEIQTSDKRDVKPVPQLKESAGTSPQADKH